VSALNKVDLPTFGSPTIPALNIAEKLADQIERCKGVL